MRASHSSLTSLAASNIDTKLDDGHPTTGGVRNLTKNMIDISASAAEKDYACYYYDTIPPTYVSTEGELSCSLSFKLGL